MNAANLFQAAAAALTLVLFASEAPAQEIRAKAEMTCQPTKESLKYDCTIQLVDAKTNAPLTGVTLTVGADMPSMPGAHNVRPVTAEAQSTPGTYRAILELEMTGVWAVQLNIAGPTRDRVVKVLRFEDEHAAHGPAKKHKHKH